MNTKADAGTSFNDDLAEIIRRLTAIARRTHTTPSGEERRHDFGEVISIAVTATAANLGGVEELLAGRPGSWEADYVRQIVNHSAAEGELDRYRTEPVMLLLDPDSVFEDAGLKDLYDNEDSELSGGYANGTEPDDNGENDAVIDSKRAALEAGYNAALDSYFTAYVETIRQVAAERGISVPVEVKRVVDYWIEPYGESLADSLHAAARKRTPLPTNITPEIPGKDNA